MEHTWQAPRTSTTLSLSLAGIDYSTFLFHIFLFITQVYFLSAFPLANNQNGKHIPDYQTSD